MGHFVNPGFRKKPQGKQNFRVTAGANPGSGRMDNGDEWLSQV